MKKFILLAFIAFSFSSCKHTAQLCTDNKADIGIEGDYLQPTYDLEKFIYKEAPYTIKRVEQGTYQVGKETAFSCVLSGKKILEMVNKIDSTFSAFLVDQTNNELILTAALFDTTELDKNNIPYRILDGEEAVRGIPEEITDRGMTKTLLVDNIAIPPEIIGTLMHPNIFKLWYKKVSK